MMKADAEYQLTLIALGKRHAFQKRVQAKAHQDTQRKGGMRMGITILMLMFMDVAVLDALREILQQYLEQKANEDEDADVIIVIVIRVRDEVQHRYAEQESPAEGQDELELLAVIAAEQKNGNPAKKRAAKQNQYLPDMYHSN